MNPVKIPTRIDDPPHILIWSADELAPLLLGLTFGVFIGQALICTIIGFAVTNAYRKFRDNNPDGYFLHMIYGLGLLPTKGKTMINPFVKRLFP